jgi:hypothetical protein
MRNLLAFTAAAVLAFAVIGWYLGWYRVDHAPASSGRHSISIDIDSKKISEDVRSGVKKGQEKLHEWLDQEPTESANSKLEPLNHPLVIPQQ